MRSARRDRGRTLARVAPGTRLAGDAPHVARSPSNEAPEGAHVVIVSRRIDDARDDAGIVESFWPS